VLDVQGDKALLLTKDIIEKECPYNWPPADVTWETCSMRKYLNTEFLKKFSDEDRKRIVLTKNTNSGNLWHGTPGGNDTDDKVFLLSIEEDDRYFGNSEDYLNKKRSSHDVVTETHFLAENGGFLINAYDNARKCGDYYSWWLRSPGKNKSSAAYVEGEGKISVGGTLVNIGGGVKVRPALWLKL